MASPSNHRQCTFSHIYHTILFLKSKEPDTFCIRFLVFISLNKVPRLLSYISFRFILTQSQIPSQCRYLCVGIPFACGFLQIHFRNPLFFTPNSTHTRFYFAKLWLQKRKVALPSESSQLFENDQKIKGETWI